MVRDQFLFDNAVFYFNLSRVVISVVFWTLAETCVVQLIRIAEHDVVVFQVSTSNFVFTVSAINKTVATPLPGDTVSCVALEIVVCSCLVPTRFVLTGFNVWAYLDGFCGVDGGYAKRLISAVGIFTQEFLDRKSAVEKRIKNGTIKKNDVKSEFTRLLSPFL